MAFFQFKDLETDNMVGVDTDDIRMLESEPHVHEGKPLNTTKILVYSDERVLRVGAPLDVVIRLIHGVPPDGCEQCENGCDCDHDMPGVSFMNLDDLPKN